MEDEEEERDDEIELDDDNEEEEKEEEEEEEKEVSVVTKEATSRESSSPSAKEIRMVSAISLSDGMEGPKCGGSRPSGVSYFSWTGQSKML